VTMFRQQNVYGMLTGFGVRVKDEREQDRNHLVETTFEVPLTYELADEILPAMARDLYVGVKGEWQPRPEIQEAVFAVSPSTQIMEVRTHPDLPADCRIEGVSLRRIKAKKAEAGTWLIAFTAGWVLGRPDEAVLMIQRLKLGVFLSFMEQAPKLDLTDADVTVEQEPAKRKRRGRAKPEDEQQQQLTEGRRMLRDVNADPEPDAAGEPDSDPDPGDAEASEPAST
jgi:hypothetical protein